jgi:hypothetical protein
MSIVARLHTPSSESATPHTAYYRSGEALRSRSVGDVVLTQTLEVPAPPARLLADWQREIAQQLTLEPGDVESLPLARARMRWPDYRQCVDTVADWTRALGLAEVLAASDVALMACRGARYHHDGAQYGAAVFCNLFLSEDCGMDVHFPHTGQRFPLVRGTALIFDTGQPHAVIARHASGFDVADFAGKQNCDQVFLTWELPVEDARVSQALHIAFDTDPATALRLEQAQEPEQVWYRGAPATVCPRTGQCIPTPTTSP